jgi:hypothetical protein
MQRIENREDGNAADQIPDRIEIVDVKARSIIEAEVVTGNAVTLKKKRVNTEMREEGIILVTEMKGERKEVEEVHRVET